MSLAENTNKVIYDGNGTSTNFTFSFKVFNEDDLRVIKFDTVALTKVVLTEAASDFVLTLNEDNIGGNIEMTAAPLATEKILLVRQGDIEQTVEIDQFGFNPKQIENQLDHNVSIMQDLSEKIERSFKVDETNENFNPSLPLDLEAGSSLFVNETNDGFEKGPLKDEIALASDVTTEIGDAISALTKADVGLDQVDNTSDINKPLSNTMIANLNNKPNVNQISQIGFSGLYEDMVNPPNIIQALTDLGIADGQDGQVLATNGAGGFSFVNQTSGSGGSSTPTILTDLYQNDHTDAEFIDTPLFDGLLTAGTPYLLELRVLSQKINTQTFVNFALGNSNQNTNLIVDPESVDFNISPSGQEWGTTFTLIYIPTTTGMPIQLFGSGGIDDFSIEFDAKLVEIGAGGGGGGGALTAGSVGTPELADDAVTPVKMTRKVVQRELQNDVNSFTGNDINDLDVTNLVVGQTYKLTVNFSFYIDGNNGTSCGFSLSDGSNNNFSFDSEYQDGDFNNFSNVASSYTRIMTFTASGTSLTASVGNASTDAYIKGGSDFSGTYLEIEEADDRTIVANF